ncbi:MAG TPA: formamidopyrimidine-DNA glycosylase [Firmicutes bacterium]|nr:formamidopyrimidine-DNA glycosylase [Bacillota bacterium]
MPELPEVESVARALAECMPGKQIAAVKFFFTQMLRELDEKEFTRLLCGRKIEEIRRRGKYILFFLSGEIVLEVHLRMTGRFLFAETDIPPGRYTGAVFYFKGGGTLHFQDMRKFGTFKLWEKNSLSQSPAYNLGPDPLDGSFSLLSFMQILERKQAVRIKPLLLNQQNLAGLGNIYADEVLHRARIHPCRTAGSITLPEKKRLFEAINTVLRESIAGGGTTFSDFRDLLGRTGNFQAQLRVYRREKERCRGCGTPIRRMVVCGRGTYYCPTCQQLPGQPAC